MGRRPPPGLASLVPPRHPGRDVGGGAPRPGHGGPGPGASARRSLAPDPVVLHSGLVRAFDRGGGGGVPSSDGVPLRLVPDDASGGAGAAPTVRGVQARVVLQRGVQRGGVELQGEPAQGGVRSGAGEAEGGRGGGEARADVATLRTLLTPKF